MTTPTQHLSPGQMFIRNETIATLGSAGIHVAAGVVLSFMNPIQSSIFGAASYLGGRLITYIDQQIHCFKNNEEARIAQFAINVIFSVLAGVLALSFAGYTLAFTSVMVLTGATIATPYILKLLPREFELPRNLPFIHSNAAPAPRAANNRGASAPAPARAPTAQAAQATTPPTAPAAVPGLNPEMQQALRQAAAAMAPAFQQQAIQYLGQQAAATDPAGAQPVAAH